MSGELTTPAAPKTSSFLREGWRELGRKLERRKLRGKMTQDDRARNAALASLGQKAWEAGIDLSDFAELSAQIKSVAARVGELAASTQKLEGEKATQEEQRRGEVARFDAQRKTQDDLKRPVDASLREHTQKQSAQDREAKRMESRLAAIAGELAAIEKQAATPAAPGQEVQAAARDAKRQQLLTEQSQLSAALPQAKQALQSLAPEVERLNQESQRLSNEIAKLEAERKAALAHIDATLDRLRGELRATGEQSKAASEERTNRFLQLGRGLYEKKKSEPALAELVSGVQKAEGELAAGAGSLRESLAQTQAMPRGTMAKFFVTLAGTPLLIIGLIYGGLYLWEYIRPDERVVTPKPVNQYLQHPFKAHPAYVLANQLVEAKSEREVADRLREALKKTHVGIYTADGHQVLAGAERTQNDFFLYDFQVKMIARAFFLRNGMVVADHTRMLGKAILELEDPTEMEPVFNSAIVQRYHEARQKPDDPMSFLILLVDGLARQQVEPYSIEETHRFSNDLILFDPIQSSLLMIDFFTRPPAPKSPASLNWMPSFVTTAYAQGPCDGILGDEGQGYWGRGFDIVGEAAQLAPEDGGKDRGDCRERHGCHRCHRRFAGSVRHEHQARSPTPRHPSESRDRRTCWYRGARHLRFAGRSGFASEMRLGHGKTDARQWSHEGRRTQVGLLPRPATLPGDARLDVGRGGSPREHPDRRGRRPPNHDGRKREVYISDPTQTVSRPAGIDSWSGLCGQGYGSLCHQEHPIAWPAGFRADSETGARSAGVPHEWPDRPHAVPRRVA